MATCSRILALKIPWTKELTSYSPWGCKELDMTERLNTHTHIHFQILFQYSLLQDTEYSFLCSALVLVGYLVHSTTYMLILDS